MADGARPPAEDELELVYIAGKLREAQAVETFLEERGIMFLVEPGEYLGGVIFRRVRIGACFYVKADDAARTRTLLAKSGYRPQPGPRRA